LNPKFFRNGIVMLVLVVGTAALLFTWIQSNGSPSASHTYSQFLTDVKGGKVSKEKLKTQLQKIAAKRTGGARTGEILGHDGGGPEGLPHSIVVTPDGPEGEAPAPVDSARSAGASNDEARPATDPPPPARRKGKAPAERSMKGARGQRSAARLAKSPRRVNVPARSAPETKRTTTAAKRKKR